MINLTKELPQNTIVDQSGHTEQYSKVPMTAPSRGSLWYPHIWGMSETTSGAYWTAIHGARCICDGVFFETWHNRISSHLWVSSDRPLIALCFNIESRLGIIQWITSSLKALEVDKTRNPTWPQPIWKIHNYTI